MRLADLAGSDLVEVQNPCRDLVPYHNLEEEDHIPCRSRAQHQAGQEIHVRRQDLGSVVLAGIGWVADLDTRIAAAAGMEVVGLGIDSVAAEAVAAAGAVAAEVDELRMSAIIILARV